MPLRTKGAKISRGPLMSHSELRLALTTGLVNAFGSISGLAESYYSAMTVPAVLAGNYGGSIELGRQRILGSILGSVLLVVSLYGLKGIPIPVAMAISMGCLRLIGGLLGLKVGYKAGGLLLVMGWLLHSGQLTSWIPLRLAWTIFGILVALLSLQWFWPSRAFDQSLGALAALSLQVQANLKDLASRIDPSEPRAAQRPQETNQPAPLRRGQMAVRRIVPDLLAELGSNPKRHPAYRLVNVMDNAHSRLIGTVIGLERRPPAFSGDRDLLRQLHQAEHDLLRQLADRLGQWAEIFAKGGLRLPAPPQAPMAWPQSWMGIENLFSDPRCNQASPEQLERVASRLVLCRQAQRAIEEAEQNWAGLLNG